MPHRPIDIKLAIELKNKGKTWHEVAKLLADGTDRNIKYQTNSVCQAVRRKYECRNGQWILK